MDLKDVSGALTCTFEIMALIDKIKEEGKEPRNILAGSNLYKLLVKEFEIVTKFKPTPGIIYLRPCIMGFAVLEDKSLHPSFVSINVHE